MSTPTEIRDQLHDELNELDGKIGRLQVFLNKASNRTLMTETHWGLLQIQVFSMQSYAECLMNRMKELQNHIKDEAP